MLRLDLKREPAWLELGHGVRLQVRPCTTALMMAARVAAAREASVQDADERDGVGGAGERTAILIKTLGKLAGLAWEGVGDAKGKPAPLTPEGIEALLDLWPMAEAFERLYLAPALLLDQEKNA